ncbi:MAG TPA: AI-2E family transporter [Candidatus Marinimicrobia bacterium]|nr:AI-2E family transporter [Candidatus Neomarinimicrobiota bacterium]
MTDNQKFIIKLMVFIGSVSAFIYFLPKLSSIIMLLLLSTIFFTIMDPLVDKLERLNISRGISALIIIVLIFFFLGLGIYFLIPHIDAARIGITERLSGTSLRVQLVEWHEALQNHIPFPLDDELPDKITDIVTDFMQHKLPGYLLEISLGIGSFLSSFFMIVFITFFMLKDERSIKKAIIRIVPNKHFELSLNLLYKIQEQLSSYLQGQFLAAMTVGILSSIGLLTINAVFDAKISYAVVIGVWAGLANLIPYVGPVAGAIPAILIVLFSQPDNMFIAIIAIIAMFMVVQFIDNTLVSPFVVGRSVNMHPLTVFLVLIIGGNLMGLLGMMFAVPMAGIIKVTVSEILINAVKYKN